MSKYILIFMLLYFIPISAWAGNTAVVRVSLTIPSRVQISKEAAPLVLEEEEASEEREYKVIVEEERLIATELVTRGNERFLLKTVLIK